MYNHEPADYQCVFCTLAKGGETEHNKRKDIFYEDEKSLAFISPRWWPSNPGNVLIVPRRHLENIYDIPDGELADIVRVGKKIALAMKEVYGCEGISFHQHNEPAGDQEVWHFHLHVFPRWKNDNLYINHNNSRYVTQEERAPYAEKLRRALS